MLTKYKWYRRLRGGIWYKYDSCWYRSSFDVPYIDEDYLNQSIWRRLGFGDD